MPKLMPVKCKAKMPPIRAKGTFANTILKSNWFFFHIQKKYNFAV
jgi:hypothetical protein